MSKCHENKHTLSIIETKCLCVKPQIDIQTLFVVRKYNWVNPLRHVYDIQTLSNICGEHAYEFENRVLHILYVKERKKILSHSPSHTYVKIGNLFNNFILILSEFE